MVALVSEDTVLGMVVLAFALTWLLFLPRMASAARAFLGSPSALRSPASPSRR